MSESCANCGEYSAENYRYYYSDTPNDSMAREGKIAICNKCRRKVAPLIALKAALMALFVVSFLGACLIAMFGGFSSGDSSNEAILAAIIDGLRNQEWIAVLAGVVLAVITFIVVLNVAPGLQAAIEFAKRQDKKRGYKYKHYMTTEEFIKAGGTVETGYAQSMRGRGRHIDDH